MCYATSDTTGRKKLDDQSRRLVHLGTETWSKAYRLLDPSKRKIVVNRNVVFKEDQSWNWKAEEAREDDNSGTFEFELKTLDDNRETHETRAVGDNESIIPTSEIEEEEDDDADTDQPQVQPRRSTRVSNKPLYLEDYVLLADEECERLLMVINDEPWDFTEARKLQVWIDACLDKISSIEKNNTWILVDLPKGVKPIGLKWVFKIKCNADGSIIKYKARLVAKGYVQKHGIDYDEVFAPVARDNSSSYLVGRFIWLEDTSPRRENHILAW